VGSVNALFDTNILIDYLNGIDAARIEIARYERAKISTITWMEVMVGATADEEDAVRCFLDRFDRTAVDQAVAERAVALRRRYRIRLPDAVIWASAQTHSALLVTRNTKDFPVDAPEVRVPYQV
jgi:predicted nucleic acid-binding protein